MTAGITQEPQEKPSKKKQKKFSEKVFVDTTVTNSRKADSIYLQQSLILDKLDSLLIEKKKIK